MKDGRMERNVILGPTTEKQRFIILDALRGLALLGICLANLPEFALWTFLSGEEQAAMPTAEADRVVRFLQYFIVDAKFYSIFSILFGIGFSIILSHAEERGGSGIRLFYRRMLVLLGMALTHLLLIWSGDILSLYAVVGMMLPLLRRLNDKRLLALAGGCILMPVVLDGWQEWTGTDFAAPLEAAWWAKAHSYGITEENFATWLRDADGYVAVHQFLMQGAIERMWEFVGGHRLLKVLGLFLIGYCIGRNRLYARLEEMHKGIKRVFWIGASVGVLTSVPYAMSATGGHPWGLTVHSLLYAVSALPMALAYMTGLCLLMLRCPHLLLFRMLAKPGRMALTNYISQSLVGIILYYGIGFGMGLDMGLWQVELTAIGIFLAQIVCSHVWMKWFKYGPLEWVWRMLTYGRWLDIRK